MTFNFNFKNIGIRILEPVLRNDTFKSIIDLIFHPIQVYHDSLINSFYKQQELVASYNSCKLFFEYILNKDFNIPNYTQTIYIVNTPNTDLFVFGYNSDEFDFEPLYMLQDLETNAPNPAFIPVWSPYILYPANTIVKFGTIMYQTVVNIPVTGIPTSNTTYWQRATYGFNIDDYSSSSDFTVYVPLSLYTSQFDTQIKSYIDQIKLFNVNYIVFYY